MNAIRCPQCGLLNSNSAAECGQCEFSFQDLPPAAYVSVSAAEFKKSSAPNPRQISNAWYDIPKDNKTGKRIYLWYRIYCGCLLFVSVVVICAAVGLLTGVSVEPILFDAAPERQTLGAVIYIILGSITAVLSSIALFSPRKPWSWVLGVVLLAIGIVGICFLPSLLMLI